MAVPQKTRNAGLKPDATRSYLLAYYGSEVGLRRSSPRKGDCLVRPGRLRTRTKGCGVLRVGALDTEATRCPECESILNQGRGCCNLVFTLISRQVFPLAGC